MEWPGFRAWGHVVADVHQAVRCPSLVLRSMSRGCLDVGAMVIWGLPGTIGKGMAQGQGQGKKNGGRGWSWKECPHFRDRTLSMSRKAEASGQRGQEGASWH